MKKALLALAATATLLPAMSAQAVQFQKVNTPIGNYAAACKTLEETWRLNTATTKAKPSDLEGALNMHCYDILSSTIVLISIANDAKAFKGICIPREKSTEDILVTIRPYLEEIGKNEKYAKASPAFATAMAMTKNYPCSSRK